MRETVGIDINDPLVQLPGSFESLWSHRNQLKGGVPLIARREVAIPSPGLPGIRRKLMHGVTVLVNGLSL